MKDIEPLRGGMERGICFLWQILKQYTKSKDVVVQYGGDTRVFALMGSHMGRYMLMLESDASFAIELSQIFTGTRRSIK